MDHALSLDFDGRMLLRMLEHADGEGALAIVEWVRDGCDPATLELRTPIRFSVTCSFGDAQDNGKERWVPLVVQEIQRGPRPADDLAR